MANKQVSVLAQYDDLCRGFNYFVNSADKGNKKIIHIHSIYF